MAMNTKEINYENVKSEKFKISSIILVFLLLFLLILGIIALFKPMILENILNETETWYNTLINEKSKVNPLLLIPLAFFGGLLGSISPCILAMLPLNLGYIGTLKVKNKFDAFKKAIAFVSGVVLVTSLFGLVSGFAGAVMVEYKGYLFITISIFILLMALVMVEWITIPLPNFIKSMPHSGPFVIGLAFALISSPCSSPVLATVLALSASSGSVFISVLTMASYGFGYTLIIFLASLFTGLSKQISFLKYEGEKVTKFAGLILCFAGLWSFYQGVTWFL